MTAYNIKHILWDNNTSNILILTYNIQNVHDTFYSLTCILCFCGHNYNSELHHRWRTVDLYYIGL
jgi:hypothetical protein